MEFYLALYCLLINICLQVFHITRIREPDVLPGQTEVEQDKLVLCMSRANGYLKETYKSQT